MSVKYMCGNWDVFIFWVTGKLVLSVQKV